MATYKGKPYDVIGDDAMGRIALFNADTGAELLIDPGDPDFESDEAAEAAALQAELREIELNLTQTLLASRVGKRTAQQRLDFVIGQVEGIRDRLSALLAGREA